MAHRERKNFEETLKSQGKASEWDPVGRLFDTIWIDVSLFYNF